MRQELKEILEKVRDDEIREFLLDTLYNNEMIYDDFRRKHLDLFSEYSVDKYKSKIDQEIRNCFNYDGYIGEDESFEYTHVLDNYIKEAEALIESKNYDLAFSILILVLETVPKYELDDSFGCVGDTMCDCIHIIERLFDIVYLEDNKSFINELYKFVLKEIKTGALRNYCIEIDPIVDKFLEKDLYVQEIEKTLLGVVQSGNLRWAEKTYKELLQNIQQKEAV